MSFLITVTHKSFIFQLFGPSFAFIITIYGSLFPLVHQSAGHGVASISDYRISDLTRFLTSSQLHITVGSSFD